ncbi:MAG: type 2 lanthipeptide synthetase LanM family protein [Cyanobacteria bacterium J06642_9]
MSKPLVATPIQLADTDLASIVADASFLWERLNSDRFRVDARQSHQADIDRRCDRWCQTVAHENQRDILEKRLQWEGLTLEEVRPRLGKVRLVPGQPLPPWAETLRRIIYTAARFELTPAIPWPTDVNQPVPFEDVLLPVIQVARQQLLAQLGLPQLSLEIPPLSVLSEKAYSTLERSLLKRLAQLAAKTLDFEFFKARPFGQNLLSQLNLETDAGDRKVYYTRFVNRLLQDGLLSFFQTYPVLGRLIAVAVDFWVEATAKFIERLAQDHVGIQQCFLHTPPEAPNPDTYRLPLGKVTDLQTALSDPHNRGLTVILITFESGLKLVYKPKDLGLEVAWNHLLAWCNQHSQLLDLKVIQVLNRDGYGWVEYVEHQPCRDQAAVKRFYQRSGMLLGLIYALRGTDCHHENLIASGEHLVLIDMETLLHHDTHLIDNSPEAQAFESDSVRLFWDSVLRTGMLPSWDFSPNQQIAYDISGLGSTHAQPAPRQVPRWQAINTDAMHLRPETITLPVEKNVPLLGEASLSPNDYQTQIIEGFDRMYRFLMQHRSQWLADDGPLAAMQHQPVRFIFRATRIYFMILNNAWAPDHLKQGADYSIELDHLSRALVVADELPDAWSILRAELRAMEQLDIPFFTASTSSDALELSSSQPGLAIQQCFKQASYQHVLGQFQALDASDLALQVAIIKGSFYARVAQPSAEVSQPWQTDNLPLLSPEQLLQAARAISSELEARALQDADGSLNWIGMGYVPQANRFQLQVLNDSLYDGRCGVALFLAALYQVTQESHFRDLSWRVLQPLRQRLQTMDAVSRQRFARLMGLGGAAGVGSILYGFVKVSQFLKDETLLSDAELFAGEITTDLIAADQTLDIMGGAAGGILGLLALYDATGKVTLSDRAIACGQHLLTHQIELEAGTRAWKTFADKPLTGFSHGAAGIAYALLKLYAVTDDVRYRESALEGITYENSLFSYSEANWPDLRSSRPDGSFAFSDQWCHGATGIGLARLGSLDSLKTIAIEQDIQIALQAAQTKGLKAIDHLCCGNLGIAEVLWVGAKRYNRPDWEKAALQKATAVVTRAQQAGNYQLFGNLLNSVFNPGLFQGTAGIR